MPCGIAADGTSGTPHMICGVTENGPPEKYWPSPAAFAVNASCQSSGFIAMPVA